MGRGRRRLRRVCAWAGAACCAGLIAAMAATHYYKVERRDRRTGSRVTRAAVYYGALEVDVDRAGYQAGAGPAPEPARDWVIARNRLRRRGWVWLPEWREAEATGGPRVMLTMPLWIPLALAAGPTAWLLRPESRRGPEGEQARRRAT